MYFNLVGELGGSNEIVPPFVPVSIRSPVLSNNFAVKVPVSVGSNGTKYPGGKFTYNSPGGIATTAGGPADAATCAGIACAVVNENGNPISLIIVPVIILQFVF